MSDGGVTAGAPRPAASKRPGRAPLIVLAVVVTIMAVVGITVWLLNRGIVSTDDAYVDGRAVTVEAKVGGYVVALDAPDNRRVKAGDVLLRIDPRDYEAARRQSAASLDLARAQLAAADANLQIARTSVPAKLLEMEAQLDAARTALALAKVEAERQHGVDPRATTRQSIDQADAQIRSAEATVRADEAQLATARQVQPNIAVAEAEVAQWQAQVQSAEAALGVADLNLAHATVTAPQDGWITRRNVELGSFVQPGQALLSLVSPDIWVTANFKESQLAGMRPGQKVQLSVDAMPDLDLEGHVDSVQMGTGARFSLFPAENATGNYVKIVQRVPVKIVIDRGLDPARPLPLGLSVVPRVTIQ